MKKNKKKGKFLLRPKVIFAIKIDKKMTVIDKDGSKKIGLPGDYKVWDDEGNISFRNKYVFHKMYQPYDDVALDIIKRESEEIDEKIRIAKMNFYSDSLKKKK